MCKKWHKQCDGICILPSPGHPISESFPQFPGTPNSLHLPVKKKRCGSPLKGGATDTAGIRVWNVFGIFMVAQTGKHAETRDNRTRLARFLVQIGVTLSATDEEVRILWHARSSQHLCVKNKMNFVCLTVKHTLFYTFPVLFCTRTD